MEPNNLNIISYNSRGFKNPNFNYLNTLFERCDFLLVQETWLYNFESNIVNSVLSGAMHHSISAMDDADIGRRGRPHGGISIIWKKDLPLKT